MVDPICLILPLQLFATVCAALRAAAISLGPVVHRWLDLSRLTGLLLAGLWGSGDRGLIVLRRERGVAPLAPYAPYTSCGPMMVPLRGSPGCPFGLGAALHGLELGQGHYIAALGPMPDRAASGGVVVVEAAAVGVEELPPLVAVSLADGGTQRGLPAALACGQVHVHALPRARLQDLHPIRTEGGRK